MKYGKEVDIFRRVAIFDGPSKGSEILSHTGSSGQDSPG
jgi:hypothetical protein